MKGDALTPYDAGLEERVRPTKWAAAALLARVYLYIGDYANAETQATIVTNNSTYYGLLSDLNSVFLRNSKEAIWQLQPINNAGRSNTGEGILFILPNTGPNTSSYPVYLSNYIVNSFETGDQRKAKWVGSVTPTPPGTNTYFYPNKYKIGAVNTTVQEYPMVMRLAELYLIRAEARAQQNNTTGAVADLNAIRLRAGLPDYSGSTAQTSLLSAILHERQVELFTEWGHRWLDLKRTGTLNAVMGAPGGVCAVKGGSWSINSQLFPIPFSELQKDPNLVQNVGY